MIRGKRKNVQLILCDFKFRKAGTAEDSSTGKNYSWTDAHQIIGLPFEETRQLCKYSLNPQCVEKISEKLETVHWGAFIDLTLEEGFVIDVLVQSDCLLEFYE